MPRRCSAACEGRAGRGLALSNSSSLKVYTFYSYKGGVGRSMALVNVGVLLALAGTRYRIEDDNTSQRAPCDYSRGIC
jgi:hypothetical protein